MPVLALCRDARREDVHAEGGAAERSGVFTGGIISTAHGQHVALFFTGRQHAGENLADCAQEAGGGTDPSRGERSGEGASPWSE